MFLGALAFVEVAFERILEEGSSSSSSSSSELSSSAALSLTGLRSGRSTTPTAMRAASSSVQSPIKFPTRPNRGESPTLKWTFAVRPPRNDLIANLAFAIHDDEGDTCIREVGDTFVPDDRDEFGPGVSNCECLDVLECTVAVGEAGSRCQRLTEVVTAALRERSLTHLCRGSRPHQSPFRPRHHPHQFC
jgi:hypothetical protein